MIYRIVLLLLMALNAKAQLSSSARFTAMGNTGTALRDASSVLNNPAGIAGLKSAIVAASIEDHFLGNDIKSQSAMLVVPTRLGVLGYYIHNYGILKTYSDLKSGLSFARQFGTEFALAITMNYHQLNINQYGSINTLSVDVGAQYYPSDKLIVGLYWQNPGSFNYKSDQYTHIPNRIHLGSSYQFSEQVLITIDGRYSIKEEVDASLGMEYGIVDWLRVRGGISLNHFQHYAGFGFGYNQFVFDTAVTVHPSLGVSPQLSIGYSF